MHRQEVLGNRVAVVTGGTFGVGRGIASELAQHGARVFVTGRSVQEDALGEHITGIRCDHRIDTEVRAAFQRISSEVGGIDILVNNVWGSYEGMGRKRSVHLDEAVLGTAPVALGRNVYRRRAGALLR